jgi:redox-sensitive bicupin YhaK (pirin superfamily)
MPITTALQRMNRGSHFRAYARRAGDRIDPFLGVDHAWMSGPTLPAHSHAGFPAVSYLFLDLETGIDNRDSLGTQNLIRPCQPPVTRSQPCRTAALNRSHPLSG